MSVQAETDEDEYAPPHESQQPQHTPPEEIALITSAIHIDPAEFQTAILAMRNPQTNNENEDAPEGQNTCESGV